MLSAIEKFAMMPVRTARRDQCEYTTFSYPFGTMKFLAALGMRILIANSCTRCC
jgi:hypothetical protein